MLRKHRRLRRCPTCTASGRELIVEDFWHSGHPVRHVMEAAILEPIGFVLLYRLSHAAYYSRAWPVSWVLRAIGMTFFNAEIHPRACLGRRLHIAHAGGILVGSGIVAGDDLKLFGRVTLGGGRAGAWPTVGADVTVFTGACVVGPARVADHARIGANTVVSKDVPRGATVAAAPPRLVPAATA